MLNNSSLQNVSKPKIIQLRISQDKMFWNFPQMRKRGKEIGSRNCGKRLDLRLNILVLDKYWTYLWGYQQLSFTQRYYLCCNKVAAWGRYPFRINAFVPHGNSREYLASLLPFFGIDQCWSYYILEKARINNALFVFIFFSS